MNQVTVIAEIFVRDFISYFSYFRLKVRNLVADENHARRTVYATPSLLYKIYRVRKLEAARVRNFYAYENFCDYSSMKNWSGKTSLRNFASTNLQLSKFLKARSFKDHKSVVVHKATDAVDKARLQILEIQTRFTAAGELDINNQCILSHYSYMSHKSEGRLSKAYFISCHGQQCNDTHTNDFLLSCPGTWHRSFSACNTFWMCSNFGLLLHLCHCRSLKR